MNIEGGTISTGAAAGSAISAGLAVGPSNGGNIGLGIEGASFSPTIVNEGPVALKFLENTVPLSFNKPIGEIIFNPQVVEPTPIGLVERLSEPLVIRQAKEVVAAAWKATEPKVSPVEALTPVIERVSIADVLQAHRTKTALEVAGMVDLSQKVVTYLKPEVRTVYQRTSAVAIQAPQKELVEEIVEEKKVVTKDQEKDDPKIKNEKKQSVLKIKIVEAVKVTQLRRSAVYEAARRVKEEAEKMGKKVFITGKKLSRFLSGEFWKYISPLVGAEGYDGTIPLTLRAIEENPREYTSLEQAQTELSKPVTEHIPLERGEGGRVATLEEVREVLEGKEKENLRPQTPAEIIIKRVVVKKDETVISTGQAVNTVVEEKEDVVGEPTLKSLGLAEIFQKAA